MKFSLIIILILTLQINVSAQTDALSSIPSIGKQLNDFIPKGYKELYKAKGDINVDGKQDIALIVFSEKEQKDTIINNNENGDSTKTIVDIKPTILITLLKENNGYKLLSKSLKAVSYWSINEMLMDAEYHAGARIKPLSIYKGGLNIYTYFRDNGWATVFQAKFKYTSNDLYLTSIINNYYREVEYCNKAKTHPGTYINKDYLSGWEITKDINQVECKLTITKNKLKNKSLIQLINFDINKYRQEFD